MTLKKLNNRRNTLIKEIENISDTSEIEKLMRKINNISHRIENKKYKPKKWEIERDKCVYSNI
jgi:seryl-tRNA synthetase